MQSNNTINSENTPLDRAIIESYLPPTLLWLRGRIAVFDTVTSTNTVARDLSDGDCAIVTADNQTAGKGRQGRSFYSPTQNGVYMSIIHREDALQAVPLITTYTATVVRRAIAVVTGKSPSIKWVNDLLLDSRKVCGILVEGTADGKNVSSRVAIVGIGINLYPSDYPSDIRHKAGAVIADSQPISHQRERLIAEVASQFYSGLDSLRDGTFMEEYRRHSIVIGKEVSFTLGGEDMLGKAVSIGEDGALTVLLTDGKELTLSSGEVSIQGEFYR